METNHKILFQNSNNLNQIKDSSIALMITSPPYPMIEMWDSMFSEQNPEIKEVLNKKDGSTPFELMNKILPTFRVAPKKYQDKITSTRHINTINYQLYKVF